MLEQILPGKIMHEPTLSGKVIYESTSPGKVIYESALPEKAIHEPILLDSIDLHLQVQHAALIIQNGGVVVFPAKCLYGLAADALNPSAVERVFNIKKRPSDKPLLVLIDNPAWLNTLVKQIPREADRLMDKFWPGDLTLVFDALDHLPDILTAGTGKIGIRIPGHPVAGELVRQCARPITGTSANISGGSGCRDIAMLDPDITNSMDMINSVDMLIDAGVLKGGRGSTVVDITLSPVRIIREGEISQSDIFKTISEFY